MFFMKRKFNKSYRKDYFVQQKVQSQYLKDHHCKPIDENAVLGAEAGQGGGRTSPE